MNMTTTQKTLPERIAALEAELSQSAHAIAALETEETLPEGLQIQGNSILDRLNSLIDQEDGAEARAAAKAQKLSQLRRVHGEMQTALQELNRERRFHSKAYEEGQARLKAKSDELFLKAAQFIEQMSWGLQELEQIAASFSDSQQQIIGSRPTPKYRFYERGWEQQVPVVISASDFSVISRVERLEGESKERFLQVRHQARAELQQPAE